MMTHHKLVAPWASRKSISLVYLCECGAQFSPCIQLLRAMYAHAKGSCDRKSLVGLFAAVPTERVHEAPVPFYLKFVSVHISVLAPHTSLLGLCYGCMAPHTLSVPAHVGWHAPQQNVKELVSPDSIKVSLTERRCPKKPSAISTFPP
ncbi:hypothetical protein BD309DRAFT_476613 [Dichomitus squalens]|nr:hypothetical protein BD309DRAFT_476613 [Dichomitus squalens]